MGHQSSPAVGQAAAGHRAAGLQRVAHSADEVREMSQTNDSEEEILIDDFQDDTAGQE